MSKIETFKIVCGMGTSDDWKQLDITDEQHSVLNKIGASSSKMPFTHEEYLNKIHMGRYEYKVECTSRDNMQFIDKYTVTRVRLTDDKDVKSNKITLDNSDGIKVIINEHAEIIGGTLKGVGGLVVSYDPFISYRYGVKKECGFVLMKLDNETFAVVSADWIRQDIEIDKKAVKEFPGIDNIQQGFVLLNGSKQPIGVVLEVNKEEGIIKFKEYGGNDTFAFPYDVVKDSIAPF